MKNRLTIILLIAVSLNIYSQTITFTDPQLKQFLLNEDCIDSDNDGFVDINADFNDDGEIQISEANSILNLHIGYVNDNYFIKSIQDISQFQNLELLKITHNDSLVEISNLALPELNTLMIDAEFSLRIVDVSDLTGLTDLRVEGCDTLDYLNIQNGSVADYFSLFYSENIHFACVDSIAAEYDEVAWRMISGTPSIECGTTGNTEILKAETIKIFPNPTQGLLKMNSSTRINKVKIFDTTGRFIRTLQSDTNTFDISFLNNGFYFIEIQMGDQTLYEKVFKD